MRCPATVSASAADSPLHLLRFGCRLGWWAGGTGVADTDHYGGGERVGQAAQQDAVVDELEPTRRPDRDADRGGAGDEAGHDTGQVLGRTVDLPSEATTPEPGDAETGAVRDEEGRPSADNPRTGS
jgi:hypothetical protein